MTNPPINSLAATALGLNTAEQETLTLLKDFLESTPPGKTVAVTCHTVSQSNSTYRKLSWPMLDLPCDECEKQTRFETINNSDFTFQGSAADKFVSFVCRNCRDYVRTYALRFENATQNRVEVAKYGQRPAFGPSTPRKFLTTLGKIDAALFLKGRRSENQGLGIAAFAYYRRVLDAQKNTLFDEIISAAKQLEADNALIEELTAAKETTRFTEATRSLRAAMPPSLLINGENPLTLLHDALSDGIHNLTDDECLERAGHVRIVLVHFVDQLTAALEKDQAVLIAAAAIKRKTARPSEPSAE